MAPPDRPAVRSWAPAVPLSPDGPRFAWLAGAFGSEPLRREALLVAAAELGPAGLDSLPVVFGVVEPAGLGDWVLLRTAVGGPPVGDGDPGGTVLLLDVVLAPVRGPDPAGDPAADPAARLGPTIAAAHVESLAAGRPLAIVLALRPPGGEAGLDREYLEDSPDPGDLERQAVAFSQAGAWVFRSGADAVRAAVGLLGRGADAPGG